MSYDVAEDQTIPEYVPLTCPKQTLKSILYKLMAKHATSYVCELCPALNIPIASPATHHAIHLPQVLLPPPVIVIVSLYPLYYTSQSFCHVPSRFVYRYFACFFPSSVVILIPDTECTYSLSLLTYLC